MFFCPCRAPVTITKQNVRETTICGKLFIVYLGGGINLKLLYLSIFRPHRYYELARIRLGKAIAIFLLFYSLLALISGTVIYRSFTIDLTALQQNYDEKVPYFTFDGKTLQVQQSQPVQLSPDPQNLVIFDTLQDTPQVPTNTQSVIVLGKHSLYTYSNGRGTQKISYADLHLPTLDKNRVKEMLPYIPMALVAVITLWELADIAGKFILITIFAPLALFMANMNKISLSFKQAWLIAGFALIPASLIGLLNSWMMSSWLTLAYWVAVFTYIYHGVNSCKEKI